MTIKDIAKDIAGRRKSLTQTEALDILRECFNAIKVATKENDETIRIHEFGIFKPKIQKGRSGTMGGVAWSTEDKKVIKFTESK
jgi:nucleoid DNA-binding protein